MKSSLHVLSLSSMVLLAGCGLADRVTGHSDRCTGPTALTVGATISDTLGVRNCSTPAGTSGRLYSLTLSQPSSIRVTATSGNFTPLLGAYTSTGTAIYERLEAGQLNLFLPAGSYQLVVARTAGTDGPFSLTSALRELGGACSSGNGTLTDAEIGIAAKGADIAGTITAADCGAVNARMHWYRLQLNSGDTLRTALTVDRAAGFALVNASGTTVISKEFSAASAWSHTYVATAEGAVTLRFESRDAGTGGGLPMRYTASLR